MFRTVQRPPKQFALDYPGAKSPTKDLITILAIPGRHASKSENHVTQHVARGRKLKVAPATDRPERRERVFFLGVFFPWRLGGESSSKRSQECLILLMISKYFCKVVELNGSEYPASILLGFRNKLGDRRSSEPINSRNTTWWLQTMLQSLPQKMGE